MVYCVGLTGTIASGKSTITDYFEKLGVVIINADDIAKKLTAHTQPAFHRIVSHFGTSVLTTSGELNRRHLRQLIFSDPLERQWLENLLHPLIRQQIEHEISQVEAPYCLIEIPLLTSRSDYPYLNRILVVQANPEQQINRFISRDNSSREAALAILATQSNENKQLELADDLLMNIGSLVDLEKKVNVLHIQYLQNADDRSNGQHS